MTKNQAKMMIQRVAARHMAKTAGQPIGTAREIFFAAKELLGAATSGATPEDQAPLLEGLMDAMAMYSVHVLKDPKTRMMMWKAKGTLAEHYTAEPADEI